MESLQRETAAASNGCTLSDYQTSDMRMILETYDKCVRRVNELNERSNLKGTQQFQFIGNYNPESLSNFFLCFRRVY